MKPPNRIRGQLFVLIFLIGLLYVGIALANNSRVINAVAADVAKLGLIIFACGLGFISGREHFRFTRTTPAFVTAMCLLILYHITELTEEFTVFQSVPLLGPSPLAKDAFETILMTGSICFFLVGNYLSVSAINHTRKQLEQNVNDVIEREEKLIESEDRYRQLTERINEWVWEVDAHGVYTYASPKVEALLGYRPVEVIGKAAFDFMPPDEAVRVKSRFSKILQQKTAFDGLENINIKKNGQPVVLETSGSPKFDGHGELIGYLGIDRDITERKQAQQARQESEERLHQLIDNSPYGAMEYELHPDGRLIFIGYNRAANRILDANCSHFMGKTIEEAFPPLTQTPIPAAYRGVASSGKPYEDEQVVYADDQISGAFEISAFQTGPDRMAVLFRDITERRRAEDKVKEYQNRLRALVSQLTLSEERERKNLAAELHDGICQSLAMVKLRVDEEVSNHPTPEVQALLENLQQSILEIMHEARALTSNLGTPMLQQLGLAAALADWMDTEISAKHGIQTEVVDRGIPKIMSEDTKSLLFRAIRELAINVVKHAEAHNLTVTLASETGELSMGIVDDGKGFEYTEMLEHDFRHHGYGLFSIHERITYVGGSMTVHSEPGKGTRIELRVPLEDRQARPT